MQQQEKMLREKLAQVYWIGGSPCAGKSAVATLLAARSGWPLYQADEASPRHEKMVTPEQQPLFYKLIHLSSEEVWMMRSVEQQAAEEVQFYREEFPLILQDLLAFPHSQPVLVEGTALLPECVIPLLGQRHQATWMVPTEEFQRTHYRHRAWAKEIVKECSDPEQAFENWMQRDRRFSASIERDALQRGMSVLVVDGTRSLDETVTLVEQSLRLAPSCLP